VGITGATGYLGQGLVHAFAANGWEVRLLGRRRAWQTGVIPFVLGEPVRAGTLEGLHALVHCAYDFSVTEPEAIRRVNVEGSRVLLTAARDARVSRCVYISSISAFAGCRSLYGKAKLSVEDEARAMGALILRPGLIWSESPASTFGNLVAQVRTSRLVPLIGDGSYVQFLVHRDDLTRFITAHCAAQSDSPTVPVTVAHDRPWPLADLLRAVANGMGRNPILIPIPWRASWLALKSAEALRIRLPFRSDSIVSIVNQNRTPDFQPLESSNAECRPFPQEFRVGTRDHASDRS
jgi:nucleoside-diphosphate-sugar epimerase